MMIKSMKDLIEEAMKVERRVPDVGPRMGGLTLTDIIHRMMDEGFVGPRKGGEV